MRIPLTARFILALAPVVTVFTSNAFGATVQCNPGSCAEAPSVQFQAGKPLSRYEAPVHVTADLPQRGTAARYVVWATVESEKVVLVYSAQGWVPLEQCGSTVPDIVSRCSHPEGATLKVLQGEFTNKQLGLNYGVVLEYARTEANDISHKGYLFQCTDFAGLGFCLCL